MTRKTTALIGFLHLEPRELMSRVVPTAFRHPPAIVAKRIVSKIEQPNADLFLQSGATSVAGKLVIRRKAAGQSAKIASEWNQAILDAIRADATGPPIAARNLAMVHLAIHDAMASAIGHSPLYLQLERGPRGTAPRVAASQAAYRVLSELYPSQEPIFARTLAATLNRFPAGRAKYPSHELGTGIAEVPAY